MSQMKVLLLVGGMVLGGIFFFVDYYRRREEEQQYGFGGEGGRPNDDEDYIEINEVVPKEVAASRQQAMPNRGEICTICLDPLVQEAARRYAIIRLPQCGHWFHQRCAIRLLEYHPNCPVCRIGIDSSSLRREPVRIPSENISELDS